MGYKMKLMPEPIRTLAFGAIGAAYAPIGIATTEATRILTITNLTNTAMMFSFDGVNDHVVLSAGSSFVLDVTTNKAYNGEFYVSARTTIHVKQVTAPASGAVYVSSFYGA